MRVTVSTAKWAQSVVVLFVLGLAAPAFANTPEAASPNVAPAFVVQSDVVQSELEWVTLSFRLQGAPQLPGVVVKRVSDGKEVPSQIERIPNGVVVHWIEPKIAKGKAGAWELVPLAQKKASKPAVSLSEKTGRVTVESGSTPLATYVYHEDGLYKPYFYPVRSPDGGRLTRNYPIEKNVPGERADHPHHRALWMTHGEVNGIDFWAEGKNTGRIVHLGFDAKNGGAVFAHLKSKNRWQTVKNEPVLEERRDVRIFPLTDGAMLIDFDIELVANEGAVHFGSTKEGSFGIRVAGTMKETSGGRIVSSRGAIGAKAAWGKPAEWIDYQGPVTKGGKIVGVTIMDHPTSFRHPTHWHVRNYGLFAANPFGHRHFYGGDAAKRGELNLSKGQSIRLKYRLYVHHGNEEQAKVAQVYTAFAKTPSLHLKKPDGPLRR